MTFSGSFAHSSTLFIESVALFIEEEGKLEAPKQLAKQDDNLAVNPFCNRTGKS